MCYKLKNIYIYILLHFKRQLKSWKPNHSFNNSKRRRMTLSCSKKLSALLRQITSKSNSDFYSLNCLRSFSTKNKLESHKKICENKDFCVIVVLSKDTKVLQFNWYRKSDKTSPIIYADLVEQIPCGYSMSTMWTFDGIENEHGVCIGEDYIKKFCESLREHTTIIEFEKKVSYTINKLRIWIISS